MKIAMYDLEGHLLEVFEEITVRDLEIKLKAPKSSINGVILGHSLTAINRQFRRYSDNARIINRIGDVTVIPNKSFCKPVSKYYNGIYVCSYENIITACEKNGIIKNNMSTCLKQGKGTVGGFEWKYAE
jgi:hypothetical protein